MGILCWIVLGLVAGVLAKLIMPGVQPGGIVVTTAIGIAGALLGGFIGTYVLSFGEVTSFDLRSLAIAVFGSLVLLLGLRLLQRSR